MGKNTKSRRCPEETWVVDKHVKRSSTSLLIKELQIKTIIYTRDYRQKVWQWHVSHRKPIRWRECELAQILRDVLQHSLMKLETMSSWASMASSHVHTLKNLLHMCTERWTGGCSQQCSSWLQKAGNNRHAHPEEIESSMVYSQGWVLQQQWRVKLLCAQPCEGLLEAN